MILYLKKCHEELVGDLSVFLSGSSLEYSKDPILTDVRERVSKITGSSASKRKALWWFVCNTTKAIKRGSLGIVFNLSRCAYSDKVVNPLGVSGTGVRNVVESLEKFGYVDIYKGGYVGISGGEPMYLRSFLVFKEPLLELWKDVPLEIYKDKTTKYVEIRDRKTGKAKSVGGVKGIKEIREGVKMINHYSTLQQIEFKGQAVSIRYKRVFNDRLDLGGRFYMPNGGIQNLPLEKRLKEVKIEGESVVELDYSSTHPNILYERMVKYEDEKWGKPLKELLGDNFCPYDVDLESFVEVCEKEVSQMGDKYNPLRNLAKTCLLVALNSNNRQSALGAVSKEMWKDKDRDLQKKKFHGIKGDVDLNKVFDALMEKNTLISKYFFDDFGLIAMKMDSDIAERVLSVLGQRGITAICLHDSFMVAKKHKEVLEQVMKESWKYVLGSNEFCFVSERKV